jgi:hypothetical protein
VEYHFTLAPASKKKKKKKKERERLAGDIPRCVRTLAWSDVTAAENDPMRSGSDHICEMDADILSDRRA